MIYSYENIQKPHQLRLHHQNSHHWIFQCLCVLQRKYGVMVRIITKKGQFKHLDTSDLNEAYTYDWYIFPEIDCGLSFLCGPCTYPCWFLMMTFLCYAVMWNLLPAYHYCIHLQIKKHKYAHEFTTVHFGKNKPKF